MYKTLFMRKTPKKLSATLHVYTNTKDDVSFGVTIERPSYSKNPSGEVYAVKNVVVRVWRSYAVVKLTYLHMPAGSWQWVGGN